MPGIPKGYEQTQIPRFTPEQMDYFNKLLGQVSGYSGAGVDYLGQLASGKGDAYDNFAKPQIDEFNQKIIPGLAAHFNQGGALHSSAFNNAAAGAAGNLETNLAAQRSQMQMNAITQLLGMGDSLLGKQPYEYGLQKKKHWYDYLMDFNNYFHDNSQNYIAAFTGGSRSPGRGSPFDQGQYQGGGMGQGGFF